MTNNLICWRKESIYLNPDVEIIIKLLPETNVTWQQLANLLHESFNERLEQGLHFSCSGMTAEQFEEKMKDGFVFVAIDKESDCLVGTATIHINTDKNGQLFGYHEYLAILPTVKHLGVGTQLALEWKAFLMEKGIKYVLSDTACDATSSVKWHIKNGFHIYALESYRSTNYWSYVFICFLDDSIRKNPIQLKLHYWLSCLFIKTTRHQDGSDTRPGKFYKTIKAKCAN